MISQYDLWRLATSAGEPRVHSSGIHRSGGAAIDPNYLTDVIDQDTMIGGLKKGANLFATALAKYVDIETVRARSSNRWRYWILRDGPAAITRSACKMGTDPMAVVRAQAAVSTGFVWWMRR